MRRNTSGAPLALRRQGMGYPLIARILTLVLTLATGSAIDARAGDIVPLPHIRSTDRHLRALIDDAVATSATVRALVERITVSDVEIGRAHV